MNGGGEGDVKGREGVGLRRCSKHSNIIKHIAIISESRYAVHLRAGPPVSGSVVFTQLSMEASGLSGVPLGLREEEGGIRKANLIECWTGERGQLVIGTMAHLGLHPTHSSLELVRLGEQQWQLVLCQGHGVP